MKTTQYIMATKLDIKTPRVCARIGTLILVNTTYYVLRTMGLLRGNDDRKRRTL